MTGVWRNSFIRLMWKVLCHCHNKATVYFNPFIMTKNNPIAGYKAFVSIYEFVNYKSNKQLNPSTFLSLSKARILSAILYVLICFVFNDERTLYFLNFLLIMRYNICDQNDLNMNQLPEKPCFVQWPIYTLTFLVVIRYTQ